MLTKYQLYLWKPKKIDNNFFKALDYPIKFNSPKHISYFASYFKKFIHQTDVTLFFDQKCYGEIICKGQIELLDELLKFATCHNWINSIFCDYGERTPFLILLNIIISKMEIPITALRDETSQQICEFNKYLRTANGKTIYNNNDDNIVEKLVLDENTNVQKTNFTFANSYLSQNGSIEQYCKILELLCTNSIFFKDNAVRDPKLGLNAKEIFRAIHEYTKKAKNVTVVKQTITTLVPYFLD